MTEGRKRLDPRMTRGGFRWQLVMVSFMAVNAIVQIAFRWNQAWGALVYLMLAMLIICAVFTAYLLMCATTTVISGTRKKPVARTGIVGAGSFRYVLTDASETEPF